jgi:hypothetical protein
LRSLPASLYSAEPDTHAASVGCFIVAVAQIPSSIAICHLV